MPRDPNAPRPGGSPRKRERRAALERGERTLDESNVYRHRSEISDGITDRVVTFVRAGNFIETACAAAGITRPTMRAWLERGARELQSIESGNQPKNSEEKYLEFHRRVSEAHALAEVHDVGAIKRAGQDYESEINEYDSNGKLAKTVKRTERGDWRALTWRLEHMHSDKYTSRVKVEVEAQLSAALDYLEQTIPPEAYRHVVESLAKRAGA